VLLNLRALDFDKGKSPGNFAASSNMPSSNITLSQKLIVEQIIGKRKYNYLAEHSKKLEDFGFNGDTFADVGKLLSRTNQAHIRSCIQIQ
jgi:hypothetical protein